MLLEVSGQSLQVVLGGAVTTSELSWNLAYHEVPGGTRRSANGTTSGATAADMLALAGNTSVQRQIRWFSVYNADTVAQTVSIQLYNGSTARVVFSRSLGVGQTLEWSLERGFSIGAVVTDGGAISVGTITEAVAGAGVTVSGAATGSATFTEKVSGTINHATNLFAAMWSVATAITTARTGGIMSAFKASLVGLAGDTSSAKMVAFEGLAPTANGGSAKYIWGYVAAGYAYLLDLTAVATGEAIIALKDNLASALEIKEAATSYLKWVTTDGSEAVAAGVRLTTTDGVSSGTARIVGGLGYRNTAASTAIDGTQEAATNFDAKYTLPANSLKAGTVLRIRAQGIHTATTGAETHSMALVIGSVTIASKAAIDPDNNDLFYFDATVVCRDAGATGHIVATGAQAHGVPGTASAIPFLLASTAIDTTGALDIAVQIDRQATATDSDSARLDVMVVEVVG